MAFPDHIHLFLLVVDLSRWAPITICEMQNVNEVEVDILKQHFVHRDRILFLRHNLHPVQCSAQLKCTQFIFVTISVSIGLKLRHFLVIFSCFYWLRVWVGGANLPYDVEYKN